MKENPHTSNVKSEKSSRREVLKWSGGMVAGSALAEMRIPIVQQWVEI
ncbi:MAG: twin-arginine translocation signal domain-containing protein [Solirubrobacterales bacterium]